MNYGPFLYLLFSHSFSRINCFCKFACTQGSGKTFYRHSFVQRMTSMNMTEFLGGVGIVECVVAAAVPAVLGAIINLGCGKKREPLRPAKAGAAKSKKNLDKSAKAGVPSASSKSKRSTKSKSVKKSSGGKGKASKKSKRSSKVSRNFLYACKKVGVAFSNVNALLLHQFSLFSTLFSFFLPIFISPFSV